MKLVEQWGAANGATLSFEVFPARTPKAASKLDETLGELASLRPTFFSVTFGAGGSTKQGSRELVEKLKKTHAQEVLAYFACYGLGPDDISSVLTSYADLGVENILAVRGDEPKDLEGFQPHPDSFAHATELIPFVKERFDFCLGAAGYPEGHVQATTREDDLAFLKQKVELGAQFIIANYFYDNAFYFGFLERCRSAGLTVPIIPGVMPIYTKKMTAMLAQMCGATLTPPIQDAFSRIPEEDKAGVLAFGIEFATAQCRDLLKAGVPGLHLYTMDRSDAASAIVGALRADGLLASPR